MSYWDSEPTGRPRQREVDVRLPDLTLRLRTEAGVFGTSRLDRGTDLLLRKAPPPIAHTAVVDLGTGYGPIAAVLGRREPRAGILAVDVNRRALRLAAHNAALAGADNVVIAAAGSVPGDLRVDGLYSNPPIKIGKAALHALLVDWLRRLGPGSDAWLVVKQAMGADTLHRWLSETVAPTTRVASKQGYRVLRVQVPGDRIPPLDGEVRDAVARSTGGPWTLLGRLAGSHAVLLQRKGIRAALSVNHGAWWWPQLQRLLPTVDRLRGAGYPTPEVIAVGQLSSDRAFILTTYVPGARPTQLDRAQVDGVLDAVELQTQVDAPPERDWSAMVTLFLNGGIATQYFRPELHDLVQQAIAALPHPMPALPSPGVVHGDLGLHNLRLRDGSLTGIVGIDAFGRGTPVIDVTALLVGVDDVGLRRHIVERAIRLSSAEVVRACLCHRALAELSWASDHPRRYAGVRSRAARILALLPPG